jgi:D-glycero-D-manno-heptose 1,7-bisphosphate phosphatase
MESDPVNRASDASALPLRPAVFFDRDGVINVSPGPGLYVESPEAFVMFPGFPAVLRTVRDLGYETVVVTNQRGVALGRMTVETLDAIHEKMKELLRREGLAFRDIRACLAGDSSDPMRKPNPGLLLEAAEIWHLDLARSWMIGDAEIDVQAGQRAGCQTVRICGDGEPTQATVRARDLDELRGFLQGLPAVEA